MARTTRSSRRESTLERFIGWTEGLGSRRRSHKQSGKKRDRLGSSTKRIRVALLAFAFVASIAAGRAITIQVFDPSAYAVAAANEITATRDLPATRGEFEDRFGTPLAMSVPAVTVVADPALIATNGKLDEDKMTDEDREFAAQAPERIAAVLSHHLGEEPGTYLKELTKENTRWVVLAKRVLASTYLDINAELRGEKLIGVYREQAPYRTYPNGALGANIVGFVNSEGEGAGGLEYTLDESLTGTPGKEVYETSPNGRIPLGDNVVTPATDGTSYRLTLDAELQWTLERRLAAQVSSTGAKSGTGIVMNVKTGEIHAMASTRTFDPNNPGGAKPENLGNDSVMNTYEPGSVQKLLTMAALLDTGTITNETRVVVPNTIQSADKRIKDAWNHPTLYLTARGVLAYSSNVGTVKLTRQLDKAKLVEYLQRFGLGSKTGVPLPGEASGTIPPSSMTDQTRDQVAFGQGLSVTTLQEAAAVAALVNGGVYHKPTILKSATDGEGNRIDIPVDPAKRVVSEETSAGIREMMESMVSVPSSGDRALALEGFRSGAKTGTAQKYDAACGCYRGYVVSVIGVAPIEDPQILTYIVIDEPAGKNASGYTAAGPAYREMMQYALVRYGIKQSESAPPRFQYTYEP